MDVVSPLNEDRSGTQPPRDLCATCTNSTSFRANNTLTLFGNSENKEEFDGTWRNNVKLKPWCWFPHHADFRSLARSANEDGCQLCKVFYEAVLHHDMHTKNCSREEAERYEISQDGEVGTDDVNLSLQQTDDDTIFGLKSSPVRRTGLDAFPMLYVSFGQAPRPEFGVALWYTTCDIGTTDSDVKTFRDHLTYSRGLTSDPAQPQNLPEVNMCSLSGQSDFLVGRLVPQAVDLDLAIEWIQNCADNHHRCGKIEDQPLPTRLIKVEEEEASDVRLAITLGHRGRYVTLSHRWGNLESSFFRTTRDNIEQHLEGIGFSELPKLFQDAVRVTRRLGYRYLWIDSLCIIQEPEDWEIECSRMAEVYQNSAVTIAAPGASTNQGTMLHARPGPIIGPVVFGSDPDLVVSVPQSAGVAASSARREYRDQLGDRGWILQERLLSPRVLYFGTQQMYFECRTHERFENIWHPIAPTFQGRQDEVNKAPLHAWSAEGDVHWTKAGHTFDEQSGNLHDMWRAIVAQYCSFKLSRLSDKLPALSGLAKDFARISGSTYAAGIWCEDLLPSLHWITVDSSPSRSDIDSLTLGPSWSWVSARGEIDFRGFMMREAILEPQSVNTLPSSHDRFGAVSSGSMQAHALMTTLTVVQFAEDTRHRTQYDLFYEMGARRIDKFLPRRVGKRKAIAVAQYFPDYDQSALHMKRVKIVLLGSPDPPPTYTFPPPIRTNCSALVVEKVLSSGWRPQWRRIGLALNLTLINGELNLLKHVKYKRIELI